MTYVFRIKRDPEAPFVPRTVMMGGKVGEKWQHRPIKLQYIETFAFRLLQVTTWQSWLSSCSTGWLTSSTQIQKSAISLRWPKEVQMFSAQLLHICDSFTLRDTLKEVWHEICRFKFISWISFPWAPKNLIWTVSIFFENSRRFSRMKVFQRCQWHWR